MLEHAQTTDLAPDFDMSNSHGKLGVRGAWVILLFVIAVPWTSARLVARFWADARGDTQRALDAYNAACNETQCPDPDAAYAAICVTAAGARNAVPISRWAGEAVQEVVNQAGREVDLSR